MLSVAVLGATPAGCWLYRTRFPPSPLCGSLLLRASIFLFGLLKNNSRAIERRNGRPGPRAKASPSRPRSRKACKSIVRAAPKSLLSRLDWGELVSWSAGQLVSWPPADQRATLQLTRPLAVIRSLPLLGCARRLHHLSLCDRRRHCFRFRADEQNRSRDGFQLFQTQSRTKLQFVLLHFLAGARHLFVAIVM